MTISQEVRAQINFQSYNPFENFDLVEKIWMTMLDKCQHSYFTSWGWISTWIKSLPTDSDLEFIVGFRDDNPVLAFFFGQRRTVKYGVLPSRVVSLNTTGNPYYDQLYIEYNSILYDGLTESVHKELLDYFGKLGCDEFILPGMSSGFVQDHGLISNSSLGEFHVIFDEINNSYFVDLGKVRDGEMDFLKLLSTNKRSQIRRSIKQYELDGKVQVQEALDSEQALIMFDELVVMHQDEWHKRGKPGAFANKYLCQFHRELIQSRFAKNEIQLLKIKNDRITIGYLYCFVYHGNVLFYQCGFSYSTENVYRPGLVSHYYAIMHNARIGMKTYDFLAGDADYKNSLSTDSVPIYWIRLFKSQRRFNFEHRILGLRNKIKTMPNLEEKLKKIRNWVRAKQ